MAAKIFCDVCGGEMPMLDDRPKVLLSVDILDRQHYITTGGNGREVDVCKYCIIDAFKKLDDRPNTMQARDTACRPEGRCTRPTSRWPAEVPRLATLEMVSSVTEREFVVSDTWLQRAWRQMYDAAVKGSVIPATAPAEQRPTHKSVPVEPTETMVTIGCGVGATSRRECVRDMWTAMLAAAPK